MEKHPVLPARLLGPLLAAVSACQPAGEGLADDVGHQEPSGAAAGRIDIPPTVRRNLGITFASVEARRVERTIRVPGAFELRPLARREYRMALPGRVELLVDQHERVEPGSLLFRFQSTAWPELLHEIHEGEQAIEASLAEIEVGKAKLEEARQRLELLAARVEVLAGAELRRADLEAQVAGIEASLPRLEAELRLSETRLENARRTREHALHVASTAAGIPEERLEAQTRVGERTVPAYMTVDWIEVRAEKAGVVEALHVTDGAFVEPPAAVLSTVDPGELRFRALALQADLPELSGALEARIVPPRTPGIPIGESVAATMTIGLDAHPAERTITLLAVPLAVSSEREKTGEPGVGSSVAPWVRSGVAAFLEIVVESSEAPGSPAALAVPRSAVVQDGLRHVFFRRDPADPNTAVRVEADLGPSDGRWVALRSGVARGDEVVVAGAYELMLASQRSGAGPGSEGGHFHADGSFHDEEP